MEEALGALLVVRPDGSAEVVPNHYEAIKAALDGGTLTFVQINPDCGVFIDDNGMLDRLQLNVPISIYAGRCLFGPCVLAAADPDSSGETMPPPADTAKALTMLGLLWARVEQDARRGGQDIKVFADPDRIPPAQIIPLTDEMFEQWLGIKREED